MADPTLVKGGTPNFLSSGGTTLTLYNTQTENVRKTAGLITINLPALESDDAISFDLLGTKREVTITGRATRDNVADLWKFGYDLVGLNQTVSATPYDTLINGAQGNTGSIQVGYIYTSRLLTDGDSDNSTDGLRQFRVFVTDVDVNYTAAIAQLTYTLTLVEISASNSS